MTFSRTDNGADTVLRIEGVLDAVTAPEIRPTIDALIAEKRQAISVDLTALRLLAGRPDGHGSDAAWRSSV